MASSSHAQSLAQGPAQVTGMEPGYGPVHAHAQVGATDPYGSQARFNPGDPYLRSSQEPVSVPDRIHPPDSMELELYSVYDPTRH
jgi:hypothetical protein